MRHRCARLTALLFLGLAAAAPVAEARTRGGFIAGPVPATVTRVVDGDTLQVVARIWIDQRLETKVRLAGIDTPELRGRCARERALARSARDRLRGLIGGGRVMLRDIRYGKYAGRVVARVLTQDGRDVGSLLLAAGLARKYRPRRRMRAGWWRSRRRSAWCAGEGR